MEKIRKKDNTLVLMCGVPGSGKSTYAKKIAKEEHIKICSSDDIREKLFGDAANQSNNNLVFAILVKHVKKELKMGNSVIIDCTNVQVSGRKYFLKKFNGLYKSAVVIYVDTPIALCKERNQKRDRIVPNDIIDKYYRKLIPPCKEEGFTYVEVITEREAVS